jgi:hypothetical protein
MTDRSREDQFDREIRDFLAWQAEDLVDPPTATDVARSIGSGALVRSTGPGTSSQLVWVLLAGLLIVTLLGAVAVGAGLLLDDRVPPLNDAAVPPVVPAVDASPTTDSTTAPIPTQMATSQPPGVAEPSPLIEEPTASAYEAVFLRLEVGDGPREVIVVGVDPEGRERQIARLPGAWVAYRLRTSGALLAPMGVTSPSGLLAIPTADRDLIMHWEIFDLHRPEAAPIVIHGIEQGLDQVGTTPYLTSGMRPRVHWAAGDRLGIPWHSCDAISCGVWSFFDGRTGAAIQGRPHSEPGCRTTDRTGADITIFDGGVVKRDADGRREELVPPSGVEFACLAPDDSMLVHSSGLSPSSPVAGLIALDSDTRYVVEGSFAGWLAVDP